MSGLGKHIGGHPLGTGCEPPSGHRTMPTAWTRGGHSEASGDELVLEIPPSAVPTFMVPQLATGCPEAGRGGFGEHRAPNVAGVEPNGGEPVARVRQARVRRASTAQPFVFDESDAY
jgi:hypothetical protein